MATLDHINIGVSAPWGSGASLTRDIPTSEQSEPRVEQSITGLLSIGVPTKSLLEVRALEQRLPMSRGSLQKGSQDEQRLWAPDSRLHNA